MAGNSGRSWWQSILLPWPWRFLLWGGYSILKTDCKKPGVAFWATVAVVVALLYVASFGPAVSLCYRARDCNHAVGIIYRPIFTLASWHQGLDRLLRRYIHLCGLSKSIEPGCRESGVIVWFAVDPKWQGR